MTPQAVTGLGVLSALGIGREAFFEGLKGSPHPEVSSPHTIAAFESSLPPGDALAEVKGFDPAAFLGDKGLRVLDRGTKLLVVAARLALHDAGWKRDNAFVHGDGSRVGLCCSNAYGSLEATLELDRVATLEDPRYINPAKFPNSVANSAAGYVSIWEDLRALNISISDGNCGGLDAFACADLMFAARRAEALLVGGGEALSEGLVVAFRRLGTLKSWGRLGEGAALLVTEPSELARRRGRTPLGHILGYGSAFGAPLDEGSVHASREAMAQAIRNALDDAGTEAASVDVVVSGLSGMERFDEAEWAGIREVLGSQVPVATPKRVLGETLGAGGALGAACALAWLHGVPPSPTVGDVPVKSIRKVLVTALGYYGNASALVLGP